MTTESTYKEEWQQCCATGTTQQAMYIASKKQTILYFVINYFIIF